MDRISISQLSTRNWWLEEDAIRYASFGFRAMSIWRDKLSDYSVDFVSTLLSDLNLNVSSVQWAGGFTGSDGRSFCDAIEDAIDAIRDTSRLGSDYLIIHPGSRSLHTQSHAHRLFRSALKELIPISRDFGVQLLIQPMPRTTGKPWTFVNDFDLALEFCDTVGTDGAGLSLNLFHWADQANEIFGRPDIADRIKLVQLADRIVENGPQRALFGTGDSPIQSWINRLIGQGFGGIFEIELYGPGVESVTYANRLQTTQRFLGMLPKEVTQELSRS